MSPFEYAALWSTIGLYAVATALVLGGFVFKREKLVAASAIACVFGLGANFATFVGRVVFTGHVPLVDRYENVLSITLIVMIFTIATIWRRRGLMGIVLFVAPFELLMLGYAILEQPRYTTYSLVLDNLWMFVHVFFAWLAYGAYTVASGMGLMYLLRDRKRWRDTATDALPAIYRRLPAPKLLDDLIYRGIIFGFVTHAVMVASGSIWARDLWGSYWSWDPVETWSLISWIIYGLWIHLRLSLRWKGRRMAWLAVVALLAVVLSYWGTRLFGTTAHSLSDLKLRTEETSQEP